MYWSEMDYCSATMCAPTANSQNQVVSRLVCNALLEMCKSFHSKDLILACWTLHFLRKTITRTHPQALSATHMF
jgi:hypothetical protein